MRNLLRVLNEFVSRIGNEFLKYLVALCILIGAQVSAFAQAGVKIPDVVTRLVYTGTQQYLDLADELGVYTVYDEGGKDVGKYTATLSLEDKIHSAWENGTTDDIYISYWITKASVKIPAADPKNPYEKTGSKITYTLSDPDSKNSKLYTVSGNTATLAGKYVVKVSLKDTKNYEWEDGTTSVLYYDFVIKEKQIDVKEVAVPTVTERNFTYDGTSHSLAIPDNDDYYIYNNERVDAGRWVVTVSLKDPEKTVWSNGTKEDLQYVFYINKRPVTIPEFIQTNYEYNDGNNVEFKFADNKDSEYYIVSGNVQSKIGQYKVSVSLKDGNNYMWSDGTVDDLSYKFVISSKTSEKKEVAVPTAATNRFIYNGKVQTLTIPSSAYYTVTPSKEKSIEVGKYSVTLSLNNPESTIWSNGSTDDITLSYSIVKAQIPFPTPDGRSFTYDGTPKTYMPSPVNSGDDDHYTVIENEQSEAGRYEVKVSLNDTKNYEWEDGTFDDLSYSFLISKATVIEPKASTEQYFYNGKNQVYKLDMSPYGADYSEYYSISGQTKKNPGSYQVVVSLNNSKNYTWSNGTTDDLIYNFVIRQAKDTRTEVEVPTVETKSFIYDGKTKSLEIPENVGYKVTGNGEVATGRYTAIVSLVDTKKYIWSDGTTDDIKIVYTINKAQVKIPAADNNEYVYKPTTTFCYHIAESEQYSISSNRCQINAGRYNVVVSLNDTKNYEWSDGTVDALNYNFVIKKAQVAIPPVAKQTVFDYDGKEKTYEIASSSYYTVEGNKHTAIGKYDVLVSLKDRDNYEWTNGTTDVLSYDFVIRPKEIEKTLVEIPSILVKNFIYDGTAKSLSIASSKYYTITGNKGTNAGRYTVTLSLNDPATSIWNDGTTDDITMTFSIVKKQIEMPAAYTYNFVYDGKEKFYHIDNSSAYTVFDTIQTNAGRYEATVSLNDTKNTEWSNGTIDDLKYNFTIKKAQVEIPASDNTQFKYTGDYQTYKIATDTRYTVEGNKQKEAGKHEVLVSLTDTKNYEWSNGTTETLIYNFVIRAEEIVLTTVAIPTVDTKNFIYDGTSKSLKIASSKDYTITGNKGVDAGRYTVILSLTDKTKTIWSDGSVDDVKIVMTIAKAQVAAPTADNTKFIYNGKEQTYTLKTSDKYTIKNNVQTNTGRYDVSVALNNTKNYEWENGSIDPLIYNFTINKAQVKIPAADETKFVYNGEEQTYNIAADSRYTVEGNKQTLPNTYEVFVSLVDPKNYEWENGTTKVLSYNFVIRSVETELRKVEIPTIATKDFIYDGTAKSLKIASSKDYTITGNKGVDAGRYTVTLSLTDKTKTIWSDGSKDDVKIVMTIAKAQIAVLTADKTKFIYNGEKQTYSLKESTAYAISGNVQTNAGRYDVSVALNDSKNYEWSNGTIDDLKYIFTINKAQVEIPEADVTKFIYNEKEQTYKIAESKQYTVEGNKQTMPGKYEVLVSLVDSKNYEWSNGTTDVLSYNFVIRAVETELKTITIPTVATKDFIYDGTTKSLKIASSKDYTVTGNKGVDAGRYTVTLKLADPTKTVWSDGSVDDVKITMTIAKAQVSKPAADNSTFVYDGKEQQYLLDVDSKICKVRDSIKTDAGRYVVTASLINPDNYEWKDGSIDDLKYNFTINKAQVEIPAADDTKFIYNEKEQTYKIAESKQYTVEGNKQTMPGKYEVLVSLVDSKNYEWSNGTTDVLSYNFVIRAVETELKTITIPTVATKDFIYDGTVKSLKIASSKDYTITGNKGVDAGRYTVTLKLADLTKTVWSDGSVDDVKITMTIAKAQVSKPAADNSTFVYDGKEQQYLLDVDSKICKVRDSIKTDAGRYVVTASLINPNNYEWNDGSIDDLKYNFTINKAQVEIPAVDPTKFIYNEKVQMYRIDSIYDVNKKPIYGVEGNKQTMPGKYEVLVSLKDTKNYEWSNGTTDVLSYNFVIRAVETELKTITIPTVATKDFIYDGTTKSLKIASSKDYTVTGNKGVDAGRYTVTLKLADPTKTVWSDGSVDDVKITMIIAKAQVSKPAADNSTFVYDGKEQQYLLDVDSKICKVRDSIKTDAGRYVVTVSLINPNNYEWNDGSIDDLKYNFTINKAQVEIPAADDTKFIYNEKEQTYKIAESKQYIVEGNKQTMPGKYEVLVSLVDSKNYEWANGTTDVLSYNFVIRAQETELTPITIPTVANKNFIYDGKTKSLKIASSKYYTVTGNKGVDAGRYTVTLSLTNPDTTVWSNGTVDDIKYVMTINKAQITKPYADDRTFVYDGNKKKYFIQSPYEYVDYEAYTAYDTIKTNAGRYVVTVSLNDTKNNEWEDGTIDDLKYNFTINKAQVEIPAADPTKFIYNEKVQMYRIDSIYDVNKKPIYGVEGNKQTMPGKYEVLVSLKDTKNYEWSNGTTDVLSYNFVIRAQETELTPITIPTVANKNFIYDGTTKSLKIASSKYYTVTGNKGVDAGRYTVTLSLTNPDTTVWSNGTVDDIKYVMTINKAQITKPYADDRTFVYDGNKKKYFIQSPYEYVDYEAYTAYDTIKTNAGRYVVTVSLNDTKNNEWEDGTIDDLKYNFTINKAQVEIPAADPTKFIYNEKVQMYRIDSIYDVNKKPIYGVEGNKQTMPGKYEVLVSLKDTKNYEWSNGTTEVLSYNFVIRAQETELTPVAIPTVANKNFIYDGTTKSLKIASSKYYTVTGNKGVDAGRYTVTLSLTNPDTTVWSNGTVDDIKYVMTINKAQITKPYADDRTFVYDGNKKKYFIQSPYEYVDYEAYTAYDTIKTNAGRYVVTVSLNDTKNNEWEDGTIDDLKYNFTINKAQVEIPAADPTKFIYNEKVQMYRIDSIYDVNKKPIYGVEGNKQTMPGKYEVLVSLKDTKNYEWSNGTTEVLSYNFVIRAQETELTPVAIPTVATKDFIYDGYEKALTRANSDYLDTLKNCKEYTVVGNSAVNAGRYTVTLKLNDPTKTVWSDGSVDDVKMYFTIAKAQVEIPDADTREFAIADCSHNVFEYGIPDSSIYTIRNKYQERAGHYNVIVSLNDTKNYEWENGSVDNLNYSFVINKGKVSKPVAYDSVYVYNGEYQYFTLSYMPGHCYDLVYSSNRDQKNAGRYEVLFSLFDPYNYEWEDGTSDALSYSFVINKAQVEIPAADPTKFIYNEKEQTYKIDMAYDELGYYIYSVEGNKQTMPGKYEVLVSLKDTKNYEWSNGTTDVLSYNFVIRAQETELTPVAIPTVATKDFIYDGYAKSLKIASSEYYTVTGNRGVDAGRYTVTLSLTNPDTTVWSDGSVDDIKMTMTINKAQVEKPETNNSVFVYNEEYQTYEVPVEHRVFDGDLIPLYNVSNNVKKEAGKYGVKISLNDAKNYEWEDGSVDDLNYNFTINKAQVAIPDADNSKFTYNRRQQTYKIEANDAYKVSGNTRTNAGNYLVSVALNDTKNYIWTDGTVDVQKYNFTIEKAQVVIPAADNTVFVYDGFQKTYKIAESTLYNVTGNKQTLPGKYEVHVALADMINYEWNDGTTTELTYNFVIRHQEIEKSVVYIPTTETRTFVYDGHVKSLDIYNDYFDYYSVTGNEGVNVGRYTVRLSLNDPDKTVWSDGSTEDILMYFQIVRAQVRIPNNNDSVFVYNGKFQTYDVKENGYYTVSGNVRKNAGRYDVKVSLNDDRNYEWSDGSVDDITMNFVINKDQLSIPSADHRKFVYNGDKQRYELPYDSLYIINGDVQVNAGRYGVSVALLDAENYEWSNGTVNDLKYSFVIDKAQVEMPDADQRKFFYTGEPQTYRLDEDYRYSIDGATQTMPGKHEVLVSLNDTKNYEWSNGTIDNLIYNFTIRPEEINKKEIAIPTNLTKNFIYDGQVKSLDIQSNDYYTVSGNRGVEVGRYSVRLSLNDTKRNVWSDGSIDDIIITFQIAKAQVEIPAADRTKFYFTGEYQTYKVEKSDLYTVSGNYQINVGNHDVIVSLKDTKNYEWNDGTVSSIVYSFLIVKKEIDVITVKIPEVEVTKFTYNSNAITLDVPLSDYYTVVGNTKTFAGKYVATVSLKDKEHMVWEDGSVDDIMIPFVINKATITTPAADTTEYIYDGTEHVYGIPTHPLYKISGNVQTLVGRHLVNVSLVDRANYMWSDGTSNDLQYEFIIKLKDVEILPVTIPVVITNSFVYNGTAQGLEIKKSPYYTISGDTAVTVGSYTATVSLKDKKNTSWEDGTTTDLEFSYTIAKAKVTIPSADTTRFVYDGDTIVCPIVENPYYIISGNANKFAGNYQVMISLIDKTNTVWENGSSEDLYIPYTIDKIKVAKPASDSTVFVYNGDTMSVDIPANAWYNIKDNYGVKAGSYSTTVSLIDKTNTTWIDGTTNDVIIPFTIEKSRIEIPAADTTLFVYTGDTLIYSLPESDYYTIKGNAQSMLGRYSVVVTLNDIENYSWSDGSSLDLIYPFIINEREIVMTQTPFPVADTVALVYNGEMQTFNIKADSNCVITGNVRMNAGRYLATVSLADRNTMAWVDGTTEDIIIPFVIAKAQVEIPAADSTVFIFNGEPQKYYIPEDSLYTIEGNVHSMVGRHDVFVSLVDMKNYEWSDGTTDDLIYRFAILHPITIDMVDPADIKVPDYTIEAGDTVSIYDRPGDYIFDIKYDSLAHVQGFVDVKAAAGDSGIRIIVPETAKPGDYEAAVTVIDIDGTVIDTTLKFTVCYPSAMIVRLMNDVLTVNNNTNEFVSYQWYKNGKKIEGATEQFFCDLEGIRGIYKVEIVNYAGDTLFIAEREFEAIVAPFNVTLSKNPVMTGEQFTVTIEGITDSNILATSSLVVYDMKGVAVINKVGIENQNTMSISNIGEYIVVARIAGGQTVSKHLLVK